MTCKEVVKWENGELYPDFELVPVIANYFGVSADELLCMEMFDNEDKIREYTDGFYEKVAAGNIREAVDAAREGMMHFPDEFRLKVLLMYGLYLSCDRPAAVKQLQVVGSQVNVPVYEHGTQDPVKTAQEAIEQCRHYGRDVLIIDTAGRLQIDTALMEELRRIKAEIKPQEILFVVDAMTGQEAVNVAKTFDSDLGVDGVILTKLDGDTRGGAALSIKAVTGKPIKFSGTGEKLSDIEPFYPDRMASRILGMGDMMTLIEKAQEAFDEKEAEKLVKRGPQELTLEDFLSQMQQMKKMGGLQSMLSMLPGANKLQDVEIDENAMKKPEAIIRSMTPRERRNPGILNASRRKRIAAGSGTTVQDVNQLINQFEQAKKMMKSFMGRKGKARMRIPFR